MTAISLHSHLAMLLQSQSADQPAASNAHATLCPVYGPLNSANYTILNSHAQVSVNLLKVFRQSQFFFSLCIGPDLLC
jgi:hypothetical protein